MDIVLGSFRYCVNNPRNPDAAGDMMRQVLGLMWAAEDGNAAERGLILRPKLKNIRVGVHRQQYDQLLEHLKRLLGPPGGAS